MKKILIISLLLFSCSKNYYFPISNYSYEDFLLQKETLNTKDIVDFANKHLISIKIDAWDGNKGTSVWENQYNGKSIPLIIFLDYDNNIIKEVVGNIDKHEFLAILNEVLNNIKNT